MIRPATIEDVDDLLIMGRLFYKASGYDDIVELNEDSLTDTFNNLISSVDGILLVADEGGIIGMVGGIVYPFYFNLNHKTGQEMFWWVNEESRGSKVGVEMFKRFEAETKNRGAESLSMIALDNLNPEKVGQLYKASGYKPSEHSYIRRL